MLALGLSIVLLAVGSAVKAPPAEAGTVDDEQLFVQLINQVRADVGLPALSVHPELTSGARSWAAAMSSNDQLAHAPDMTVGVTAPWTVLGENVGVHGIHDPNQLFQAFVASPAHYQNLVDPRFQYVGVGVIHASATGKLWTTHRFMAADIPAPPPTTAAPTTTPPTTASPTTASPTTAAPTTTPPTTAVQNTGAPKTSPPTTVSPVAAPSTSSPVAVPSTATEPANPGTLLPTASGEPTAQLPISQAEMAELVAPDVSTIEEVLIDLLRAGI